MTYPCQHDYIENDAEGECRVCRREDLGDWLLTTFMRINFWFWVIVGWWIVIKEVR